MAQVPTNLIPLRVTQLPTAPVASEDSLMMIVYQGNNYQIRVGDLLSVAGVPLTRQVIAGTGMSGGGQLSENVTLSVASKGINGSLLADTGVTAGVYGDATNIPVMTVDSTGRVTAASSVAVSVSGYVPVTREVIAGAGLTGGGALNNNVTLAADLADTTPEAGFQTGSAGTAEAVSRADHKHPAVDLSSDDEVDNILGLSNGGTARSLVPDAGAIIWCGADGLYVGPVGQAGQVLISSGTGEYTWGSALVVVPQAANTFFAGPTSGGSSDPLFRTMVNADLPDSGATAGTYGSALAIPVVTVNAKGVVTSITTTTFTGGLSYKGAWNASTNSPTLTSGTGTNGDYYVVSVAGNTNLDGITDWQVGDWALFNGTVWQKIDQTNSVSSVNGQTGAVSLDYADVGAPSATGTGASGTWAIDVSGNAATVTNGVYTNGSYADPTWLTSLAGSKVSGDISGNAANVTGTVAVLNGGTGATTASGARTNLGATTVGDAVFTAVNAASGRSALGAAASGANADITSMSGLTGGITTPDYVTFDTTPETVPTATGSLYWDSADSAQTLSLVMTGGNAIQQIGEETYYRIKASSAITEGQVVMFTGTVGASGALTGAPATGLTAGTASYVMGVATEDIALNGWGYVTHFGLVRNINTTGGAEAWVDGQILYYDPTVAGGLTKNLPSAPNAKVQVCAVIHAASSGSLFIRPAFGGELGQYEGDVQITTPANGQLLIRDQTAGKWVNATLTDGTGISVTEGAGTVTVTNTAPDQVVTLTQGGTTTITGTYPNFTISSADQYSGTVTSVSGTGTVSGISLSGTVTSSGSLTLGGALDLSSPPVIGGTTPAAITGTTITATTYVGITGGTF